MKAEEIFDQAIQMTANEQRDAYVASACGTDAALLAKIQSLLKAHDEASQFLQQSLFESAPTVDQKPSEGPGTVIGPYKLLQEIGHGGMGVVFMAEQHQPVKRRVALKIIKPGMDSRQVIARFEAERQALSLMDHPNIAKVLDAGTTSSGRPYFVMELVKGQPITKYCDEHHMTPRQRLELLLPVCQAIQHAHQKGIIHRDIKPSNILVAEYDNKPVPKVIDFGVAKAIHQPLTDKTMFTGFGNIVGTLEYMSPEQAKVNQLDIDTRSDIYSLGVLMYELLTGSTPFDRKRLKQAAWDEMLRIIREEEPQRPSTRISTTDELPSIAVNRGMEPKKLSGLVHGELDWIVMKALDKDRNRRYETANGFAMDLQRYLANEAVSACPPSAGYRFRKFVSRNKAKVLAASIVAAALLLGILGTTWGMMRARAERDEKELARQEAEESFQRTRQVVDDFFTLVSQNTIFNVPGLQPVRKELLEKARDYYQETHQKRPDDPNILAGLAVANLRLSTVYYDVNEMNDMLKTFISGLDQIEKLRVKYPAESKQHRKLAGYWKGVRKVQTNTDAPQNLEAANTALLRFVNYWTQFSKESPAEVGFQSDLAAIYGLLGALHGGISFSKGHSVRQEVDYAKMWHEKSIHQWEHLIKEYPKVAFYRESLLDTLGAYSAMLRETGKTKEAEQLRDKIYQLGKELASEHPTVPQYREYLIGNVRRNASLLTKAGKVDEAEQEYRQAIQLLEEHVALQSGITGYGTRQLNTIKAWIALLRKTGKVQDAEPVITQFLVNCRKRLNFHSELPIVFRELTNALAFAAEHAREQGRNEDAEAHLLEIHALFKSHKPNTGREHEHQEMLGSFLLWQLRPFYEMTGRMMEREEVCKEALAIFEKLTQINNAQSWLYWLRLGEAQIISGKGSDAIHSLSRSIELKPDLSGPWHWRGDAHASVNDHDKAIQDYSKAIAIEPIHAWTWRNRAWNYTQVGQWEKAVADYRQAIKLDSTQTGWHFELGIALDKIGKHEDAISAYRKASELEPKNAEYQRKIKEAVETQKQRVALDNLRKEIAKDPKNPVNIRELGILYDKQGNHPGALNAFQKVIELEPDKALNHNNLGIILFKLKKPQEAIDAFRKAIELDPKNLQAHSNLASTLMSVRDISAAIATFRKVIELDPKNDWAMNNIAWLYLTALDITQRNPQEALTLSRKAVELTKDNWVNLDTHSVAAYRNEQWKESLESREKMIKLRKPRTEDKFFLAMCLWKLERKEEAQKHFAEALAGFDKLDKQDEWLTGIKKEAETLFGTSTPPAQSVK